MENKQIIDDVKFKIIELEDRLMNIIELASQYPKAHVPIFEEKMIQFLKKLDI